MDNALFYAIKAQLLFDNGDAKAAGQALEQAIAMTGNELERKHLGKKLATVRKSV